MSIIGEIAVPRSVEMHPKQGACTLVVRGVGNVSYSNSYGWPELGTSALGRGGTPNNRVRVTLYQQGESYAPEPDDNIIDADGRTWNIMAVNTRLKFPDNPSYAKHDCELIMAG